MALATYSDLKSSIASWLDREDAEFNARAADFITLAEQRLNYGGTDTSGLRVAEMEKNALVTVTDGIATLPADYLEYRLFRQTKYPFASLEYSTPGAAADSYDTWIANYSGTTTLNLLYYAKIPALSDANPTNWLLTKAPGAYLYGALLEAVPFEADDARMQTWGKLYAEAIAGLKRSDVGARFANVRSRVRGPTP